MSTDGKVTVTRWWWIRHAPTDVPPGTLTGRSEAPIHAPVPPSTLAALASLRANLPETALHLVVTGLSRSRETARHLIDDNFDIITKVVEKDFEEQSFGNWEGGSYDAVPRSFWDDPANAVPPGGESFADLCLRVKSGIERHSHRVGEGDIVAVAHAGSIRAAVADALSLPPARALSLALDPLSLTRLDRIAMSGRVEWRIVTVNAVSGHRSERGAGPDKSAGGDEHGAA